MQKIYQYANSKTMLLSEIKVPQSYRESEPSTTKYLEVNEFFNKYGILDQPIILNANGYIMDGYIRYLVAKAHDLKTVPVIVIKAKIHEKQSAPIKVVIRLTLWERLTGKLRATV